MSFAATLGLLVFIEELLQMYGIFPPRGGKSLSRGNYP